MEMNEKDHVHQVRNELVRILLIPPVINLIKKRRLSSSMKASLFGNKICYKDTANDASDEEIVWLLGREYAHHKLPQYSCLFGVIVIMGIILARSVNPGILILLLLAPFVFSRWLKEDVYRSDIFGSYLLLRYGKMKGIKVSPSEILRNSRKSGRYLIHPTIADRIKRLKKLEDFYYNQKN